jgi:hypothetical protein
MKRFQVTLERPTIETSCTIVDATDHRSAMSEALARARAGMLEWTPVQFSTVGEAEVQGYTLLPPDHRS